MTPETTPPEPLTEGNLAPVEASVEAPKESSLKASEEAPFEIPTWEDDETLATAVFRALFVLLAAGFLTYSQWNAPASWTESIGQNWGRWVSVSVIFNFLLPLGIVWMFFGQGLVYQDWLKEQKHNAWNYGWNFSQFKRHLLMALGCWAVALPFVFYFSRDPQARSFYVDSYLPPMHSPKDWAFMLSTLVLYMFCWEWFFRGFTLFGIAQGVGPVVAIALQTILFGLAHTGKPVGEMWSAYAGGLVLGTLAWREKSFVPAFLIHASIHVTWAILVFL